MRHFQEFLLAIDVASFGEVYISQWNTQRRTPVGFQVLFFEINWKGFFLLWRCCQNQLQMYDVDGNGVIDQQDGMTKIVQQVNVRI